MTWAVSCPRCRRMCPSSMSFSAHVRAVHPEENITLRVEGLTERGPVDECWTWHGTHTTADEPQPQLWVDGRHQYVTRVLLDLLGHPEVVARHTCDNPSCVNPSHLVRGSVQDNVDDRGLRKRTALGEGHGKARLTRVQVRAIRANTWGETERQLATRFNVSKTTIHGVLAGDTWKEVV